MELTTSHIAILKTLFGMPLQTEHQMAAAVCEVQKTTSTDVLPLLPKMLRELRTAGLIWAGELTAELDGGRASMWGACLTKAGRERMKHVNAATK